MHLHVSARDQRTAEQQLRGPRWARTVSIGVLAVVAVAIIAGMVALWPNYDRVAEVASAAGSAGDAAGSERGEILGIDDGCDGASLGHDRATGTLSDGDGPGAQNACRVATVGILSGPDSGQVTTVTLRGSLAASGLKTGDRVELAAISRADGDATTPDPPAAQRGLHHDYSVSGVSRGMPLLALGLVFALVLVIVGRLRGLLSLAALALSAGVLFAFMLPALITGGPGLLIGVVAASAIMLVTLYFVHGISLRTTSALIGTLAGIGLMALCSLLAVHVTRLSGIGDEATGSISTVATDVDFRGVLSCAVLIAGLGVLNDVTITQASAVWELRAAAPGISRHEVFARAMRIGRDHIASTVYTVFFAYVGAALGTLLLMYLFNRSFVQTLSVEEFATEIVRTFVGSVGLILAVPITTWVATLCIPAGRDELAAPPAPVSAG